MARFFRRSLRPQETKCHRKRPGVKVFARKGPCKLGVKGVKSNQEQRAQREFAVIFLFAMDLMGQKDARDACKTMIIPHGQFCNRSWASETGQTDDSSGC